MLQQRRIAHTLWPDSLWEMHQRQKRKGFEVGVCSPIRKKRFGKAVYEVSQHFMPEMVFPRVRFLRRYFEHLDKATAPKQASDVYRTEPVELFDTAIDMLWQVRNHLSVNNPYCIGSKHISGVAWGVIGNFDYGGGLARHHWPTFVEMFTYYGDQVLSNTRYDAMNVYRREHVAFNKARNLAGALDQSESIVLAIAILFLYDIVKNCGPDSEHFLEVFTNDSRSKYFLAVDKWLPIYQGFVSRSAVYPIFPPTVLGRLPLSKIVNQNTCVSPYSPGCSNNTVTTVYRSCNYSDVEILDVSAGQLIEGEKVVEKSDDYTRYGEYWG